MPRIKTNLDYYAILNVSNAATLDEIKKSYRSRARDVHPDKNPNDPAATAEFQRLLEAYDTLKDPGERLAYDIRWPGIRSKEQVEKTRKDAEEASRQQATQDAAKKRKAEEERQGRLSRLMTERNRYQGDLFEANRRIKRITVELARLQGLDDEELRKEKQRNSWWTYLSSPLYGKMQETEEQKRQREVERMQRVATRSIKKNELVREEGGLQRLNIILETTIAKIDAEHRRKEEEHREAEMKTRATAAKRQAEFENQQAELRRAEQERRRVDMVKRQQEADRLARQQREKRERDEAVATEARLRAEQLRQEELNKIFDQLRKEEEELARRSRYPTEQPNSANRRTICQHAKFWPKITGSQSCSHCGEYQRRFAFQCPDCKMRACTNCRRSLRGEVQRPGWRTGSHNTGPTARQDAYVDAFWDYD